MLGPHRCSSCCTTIDGHSLLPEIRSKSPVLSARTLAISSGFPGEVIQILSLRVLKPWARCPSQTLALGLVNSPLKHKRRFLSSLQEHKTHHLAVRDVSSLFPLCQSRNQRCVKLENPVWAAGRDWYCVWPGAGLRHFTSLWLSRA